MKNTKKNFGAETVEQFKVMQFIGEQFAPGAAITFYWDPDAGEVKWHD